MDIYTPDGDTVTNRPVIIYLHGGVFTTGNKNLPDCVDFCTAYAKKGYVAISANYRLSSNSVLFAIDTEEQYNTVLKSVSEVKAAVRYLRKEYDNGNSIGIHPDGIFLAGYSAGAVLAIHLDYLDEISDLPTSPINVQDLVSNIGGSLEGDAGNNGYSSEVSGIVSFAGGINNLSWIDSNDKPIVFVHGTNDFTVNYNCGPGINIPTVLNLCGMNAMKPALDNTDILNDTMIYINGGHGWAGTGHANPLFTQAVDFSTDFLYPLLPCNNSSVGISEIEDIIKQYPNPAKDIVHYSSGKKIEEIVIYNQIGHIKNKIIVNNTEYDVDLTDFERGIYYLKLVLDNSRIILKKLSVSK
jgi:predicted esterase